MTWRDRFGQEATCVRCLEVRDTVELDRLLWCEACRARARRRAGRWGWLVGLLVAGSLAAWIRLAIRPSPDLILGGWIATVAAALWLAARIAREAGYGLMRFLNRRAAEAVPPTGFPEADEEG